MLIELPTSQAFTSFSFRLRNPPLSTNLFGSATSTVRNCRPINVENLISVISSQRMRPADTALELSMMPS